MRHFLPAFALILVACGGKVPPEEVGSADTGSNGSDTGTTVDGAVADGTPTDAITKPDSPPPSKETCTKYVASMCGDKTKACCGTSGFMWNPDGCNANFDYYCNALVDQVTLGRAVYDESFLADCLKGWEANYAKCEIDSLASARNQIACTHLFNGTKKVGETCTGKQYVECEAPAGFGAYCDVRPGESSGKCRAYGFVGKDQPCNYYGSTVRYCDTGFYCDLTSTAPTCQPAKAIGATCAGTDDFSCGLSANCTMNKCQALGGAGAMCARNEECASYSCMGTTCTKAESSTVSAWVCGTM